MWQQWTGEQLLSLGLEDEDSGIDTCHVSCMWLNGDVSELWRPILVNEAAHLFISVDIQLGCILDPEDGVSMRGSSCLKFNSDSIVD